MARAEIEKTLKLPAGQETDILVLTEIFGFNWKVHQDFWMLDPNGDITADVPATPITRVLMPPDSYEAQLLEDWDGASDLPIKPNSIIPDITVNVAAAYDLMIHMRTLISKDTRLWVHFDAAIDRQNETAFGYYAWFMCKADWPLTICRAALYTMRIAKDNKLI